MSLRGVVENLEATPSSQLRAFCRETSGAAATMSVPASTFAAKALKGVAPIRRPPAIDFMAEQLVRFRIVDAMGIELRGTTRLFTDLPWLSQYSWKVETWKMFRSSVRECSGWQRIYDGVFMGIGRKGLFPLLVWEPDLHERSIGLAIVRLLTTGLTNFVINSYLWQ